MPIHAAEQLEEQRKQFMFANSFYEQCTHNYWKHYTMLRLSHFQETNKISLLQEKVKVLCEGIRASKHKDRHVWNNNNGIGEPSM